MALASTTKSKVYNVQWCASKRTCFLRSKNCCVNIWTKDRAEEIQAHKVKMGMNCELWEKTSSLITGSFHVAVNVATAAVCLCYPYPRWHNYDQPYANSHYKTASHDDTHACNDANINLRNKTYGLMTVAKSSIFNIYTKMFYTNIPGIFNIKW